MNNIDDTICALATGGSISAIAIIRISGKEAINITNKIFSKNLKNIQTHTIHFGTIKNKKEIIDEVIVSVFKKNKSYTGEETIEITCHGSIYIQNKIIQLLIEKGCRMASAGEFTLRAFKNGKIDLSQAEAVADLIASSSKSEQQNAIKQLKGGFSKKLERLRNKLIDFGSLIELELDFSEEDVEFADRKEFLLLLKHIKSELENLIKSFQLGNVMKNGIPISILGCPNSGKSTLLNILSNEEKAIVSEIAGTTRDAIEEKIIINNYNFRFIDTAGIRETNDEIEQIGIKKTFKKAEESYIILFLIDIANNINDQIKEFDKINQEYPNKIIAVINKIDLKPNLELDIKKSIRISAKKEKGLEELKNFIVKKAEKNNISTSTIITNSRHYEELNSTLNEVNIIIDGIKNNISTDLISTNIRQALFHLGSITGQITTDTLLANIFSKFCIGK